MKLTQATVAMVTCTVLCLSDVREVLRLGKVTVFPIQATKALRTGRGIALPNLRPRH